MRDFFESLDSRKVTDMDSAEMTMDEQVFDEDDLDMDAEIDDDEFGELEL